MSKHYSPKLLDLQHREFMSGESDYSRFVIRKFKGTWYGVDNAVSADLGIPFSSHLLMLDEDAGEADQANPVDVLEYMQEIGVIAVGSAPSAFQARMDKAKKNIR